MSKAEIEYLKAVDFALQSVHLPNFLEMLRMISTSESPVQELYFYTFGEHLKANTEGTQDEKSLFVVRMKALRKWADEEATLDYYKKGLLQILDGGPAKSNKISEKNRLLAYMYFDLFVRAPNYNFEVRLECAANVARAYLTKGTDHADINQMVEDFVAAAPPQARIYYN